MTALKYYTESYELINGVSYMMSRPKTNHIRVERNILSLFSRYLKGKTCEPFNESDVFLGEEANVVPDVMIVCDPTIIEDDGIHGVPDLVVEILSKSTAKRDKSDKLKLYEKYGVKEYWIADPSNKLVDVYLLNEEGKYYLSNTYVHLTEEEYEKLDDYEKEGIVQEIKVSLYDDLIVKTEDVFEHVK